MKTIIITKKMSIGYDKSETSRHEFDSSDFKKEVPADYELVSQTPQITASQNELFVSYAFQPKSSTKVGSGLGATVVK